MPATQRRTNSNDATVRSLAVVQHSVVGARQLRECGVDRSWVWREIRAGRLHRPLPDAYFVGPGLEAMSERSWLTAALHSCHLRGALYRETAIERLLGWRRRSDGMHIVTTIGRDDHASPTITFHRTRTLQDVDILVVAGDRTTCMTRTIFDLAYVLTPHQLANVLHDASFHGQLDLIELQRRLELERGHPWTAVVRAAVELFRSGSAGTRSMSEDKFLGRWMARGFPEPHVNDPAAVGGLGIECDFVWPERRLIVEIDGDRGHARPNVLAKDQARDAALRAAGWRVVRISTSQIWNDLDGCIEAVRSAYVSFA